MKKVLRSRLRKFKITVFENIMYSNWLWCLCKRICQTKRNRLRYALMKQGESRILDALDIVRLVRTRDTQ